MIKNIGLQLIISCLAFLSYSQAGSALHFDGINDRVHANITATPTDYTLAAHFNADPSGSGFMTIMIWQTYDPNKETLIDIDNAGYIRFGQFDYVNGSFQSVQSTTNVKDGQWHHVAASKSGNQWSLYVDGVLEATLFLNGNNQASQNLTDFRIGAAQFSTGTIGQYFKGSIDEVQIWDSSLCEAAIQYNSTCEVSSTSTGLIAYYQFNEGLANQNNAGISTVPDISGNGNTGTMSNFSLSGTSSNWVTPGAVTSGVSCSVCPTTYETITVEDCLSYTVPSGDSTYTTVGSYTVQDTAISCCGGFHVTTINITIHGAATFALTVNDNLCAESSASVQFSPNSPDSLLNWTLGNIAAGSTQDQTLWGDTVLFVSDEYSPSPYSWSSFQATGAPNVLAYGDDANSWTPSSYPIGLQYIELGHGDSTGVIGSDIVVHQSYNPGAITEVAVKQVSTGNWIPIYTGVATSSPLVYTIGTFPIPSSTGPINATRVTIDTDLYNNYVEIDAVGIVIPAVMADPVIIDSIAGGTYLFNVTNIHGCQGDTLLTFATNPAPLTGTINSSLCYGDSLVINGTVYDENNLTGTEVLTSSGPNGCDSTVTINISVLPEKTGSVTLDMCYEDSMTINGTVYDVNNPSGVEVFTGIGPSNCDSTVTVNLTFLPEKMSSIAETVCPGESVTVNGTVYDATNPTGVEVFAVGPNGCDSTVTINLNVVAIDLALQQIGSDLVADQTGADAYQWLDCSNGNSAIVGANSINYTPTTNGDYAVEITIGSCSDTSACFNVNNVGLEEYGFETNVNLYPNPTQGSFTLEFGEVVEGRIEIYSAIGKLQFAGLLNDKKTQIDLSDFSNGVYIVKVKIDDKIISKRIVKR